jgi:ABC-type lipoprotein release transport system permease subunit
MMWVIRTITEDSVIMEQSVYRNRDLVDYHISPAVVFSTSSATSILYGKTLAEVLNVRQGDGKRVVHNNIRNRMEKK